jgi:hypothetical protein
MAEKQVRIIDATKLNWNAVTGDNGYPGDTNMIIGCLQRIASAQEKQAENVMDVIRNRDNWKNLYESKSKELIALKKQFTRYKNSIKKNESATNG